MKKSKKNTQILEFVSKMESEFGQSVKSFVKAAKKTDKRLVGLFAICKHLDRSEKFITDFFQKEVKISMKKEAYKNLDVFLPALRNALYYYNGFLSGKAKQQEFRVTANILLVPERKLQEEYEKQWPGESTSADVKDPKWRNVLDNFNFSTIQDGINKAARGYAFNLKSYMN